MPQRIGIRQLQVSPSRYVEQVRYHGARYIITAHSVDAAAIISLQDLERLESEVIMPAAAEASEIETEFLKRYNGDKKQAAKALAEFLAAGQQALLRLLKNGETTEENATP